MSIGMDRFAAVGQFPTYEAVPRISANVMVFTITCRACGFEPEDAVVAPRLCPKCHGNAWERYARPGSILENAARY
jgi:predicted Zn-ribbon and HTH transcriptional regulator